MFVGVDQVDVGTEVELAAAELAQAENDQPLHVSVPIAHDAVALGEFSFHRRKGDLQAAFGQIRAAGERGVDIVQAKHVPPDQPRRSRGAVAAQQCGPVRAVVRVEHRFGKWLGAIVAQEAFEQIGLARERIDGEIAGDGDAFEPRDRARIGQRIGLPGQRSTQPREDAGDQGLEAVERGNGRGRNHCSDSVMRLG